MPAGSSRYSILLQFYALDNAARAYLIWSNCKSLVRPIVAEFRTPNTLYNALVPSLQQLAAVCSDLRLQSV